jgi:peroxiredoxin
VRRGPYIALVLALCAAQLPAQPAAPASSPLPDLLNRYGIRPIRPAAPASNFTLDDLAGGQTSLSDYYGSWVVLTFFATWCGPCRQELPTLERLHQERAADGVVVLGVSVDDPGAPLPDFVRQLQLTFPILWDKTKQVGGAYRASSIPITYLVSPEGQLVGVSRGSRDWAALASMFDGALAAVPATLTVDPGTNAAGAPAAGAYADAGAPVATPSVSDPPTAEVRLTGATPRAGEPFTVEVELFWAGNFDEYMPHPPEILLPEGVVQESVTAESSSRQGRNHLTYTATLRADKPGKYALDPVEVRYTPRFDSAPVAARVAGPTVEVVAPTILGVAPRTLAAGVGGFAALGLVGFVAARKLRGRRSAGRSTGTEAYEALAADFEAARKMRRAGDGAGCLLALAELDRALRRDSGEGESEDAARESLAQAVERARYGGEVPPAQELDRLQRSVERRLEALRPNAAKHDRQGLKLKDDEPTEN